ncbi:FecR domain-containing protein [Mucilaginibacter sp. UR6-1]|uniref:FecR family protein n=1 Tax=Mucilaginibacter sp. UR6-1 TaxID=1435643 RepID=UPI001E445560|nr:FecR domain-containing protein [Mucilaginibacter sp. UR6-1]MCC8407817.1 FecR domain-containing protein [Mucilaginibacter sp. UR6-1]
MTKQLIHKYFSGTCTPEEEVMVKTYLEGNDLTVLHEYMDEVATAGSPDPLSKAESDELLGSIHHQIQIDQLLANMVAESQKADDGTVNSLTPEDDNKPGSKVVELKFNRGRFNWSIAACLLVLLTCGGLLFNYLRQKAAVPSTAQYSVNWSVIANKTAGIKKIILTDGTSVWLNSASSISYQPANFDRNTREVIISGEAFFDVAHNVKKPFIVHAGKLTTTVLGTAFNVEAYHNEGEVKVTLVRGRVRVETANERLMLAPGQMLKYLNLTKHAAITTVNTTQANAWTTGKISFTDVSLSDALKRMAIIYGVKISPLNYRLLNNRRITGVFERKPIDKILTNVLYIHGLKWEKKGGEFIIQQ